jgi:DNA invertase Pin-like site-specific DNA recombinase
MKAAIYVRVSKDDQSVDMQLEDLHDYVKLNKLTVYKEYCDEGVSSREAYRPALERLMKDARNKLFDVVVVWRFDRFARSAKQLAIALDTFQGLGIQFISFKEKLDTTTPMGAAMFTIIGAMAQLERDLIRERTIAGLKHARSIGKVIGRPRSKVVPDQAKLLRAQGMSYRAIAKLYNASVRSVQRAIKLAK